MLVLTRNNQETICIEHPDGIVKVKILGVDGSSVKVGVTAPRSVQVLREELLSKSKVTTPNY